MTYDLGFMDNATSLPGLVTGSNTSVSGAFGVMIFASLVVIIFMLFREREIHELLLGGGFLLLILSGALFYFGLLGVWAIGFCLVGMIVGTVLSMRKG